MQGCLLEHCAAAPAGSADAVVSTHAVHHLPRDEKQRLFDDVARILRPGGRAAFGDLMLGSAAARDALLAAEREAGAGVVAAEDADELLWLVDESLADLAAAGLPARARQVSALSWTCVARR